MRKQKVGENAKLVREKETEVREIETNLRKIAMTKTKMETILRRKKRSLSSKRSGRKKTMLLMRAIK